MRTFYILCCDKKRSGGGIYKFSYEASPDEIRSADAYFPADNVMYAVLDAEKLHVIADRVLPDNESGIYSLDKMLCEASDIKGTNGDCACHLCVDGDSYVVNYMTGNIVKVGGRTVQHEGSGVDPERQEQAHTHCAIFSPDKKYVLCCDLGLDQLVCYDRELNIVSAAEVTPGYGIRHAVFSKDGKYIYAITEMVPAIAVFSFDVGMVELVTEYTIECREQRADGAAIRLSEDGGKLYASLRVENEIAVFDVKKDKLTLLQKVSCGGRSPRDFNIIDDFLIVTNEKTDNVCIFKLEGGLIGDMITELKLTKPLCCVTDENII